jgi:YebC/PmpR family DNA-binding regulatory protein
MKQQWRNIHSSSFCNAGHSHWSNIQHHKGKKDIARSQQFARIAKEITMLVRMEKNGNPSENPKLATAISKGKAVGFPRERIEAAIDKGLGRNQANVDYSSYELHGPLKVAFIVDTASDSKNRIVANLRSWATRRGGSLATNGAFNFLFQKQGVVEVNIEGKSEDEIMEAAINAGAEDVAFEESKAILSCKPDEEVVYAIRSALESAKLEVLHADVQLVPTTTVDVSGEEDLELFQSAMTALTEIEGVETIVHNAILDFGEPI